MVPPVDSTFTRGSGCAAVSTNPRRKATRQGRNRFMVLMVQSGILPPPCLPFHREPGTGGRGDPASLLCRYPPRNDKLRGLINFPVEFPTRWSDFFAMNSPRNLSRREFLATSAAAIVTANLSLAAAAEAEPIIDIHQHVN